MGTHDELLALKGVYHRLVVSQTQDKSDDWRGKRGNHSEQKEPNDASNIELPSIITTLRPNLNWTMQSKDTSKVKVDAFGDEKANVKQKKEASSHFEKKLLSIQKSDWIWLVAGCLSQMILGSMLLGLVLLFTQVFEIFSECDFNRQLSESLKYMGLIFGLGGITMAIMVCLNYSFALTGARLTKKLRVLMFESMLKQEVAFHDLEENRSSVLSTLLATSTQYCRGLTSDKFGLYCLGFSCIGFSILVSFVFNWKLASVMLAFVPAMFVVIAVAGKASLDTKTGKGKTVAQETGRLVIETVENIRTVVSLTREDYFVNEFKHISNRKFKRSLAMFHIQAVFYSLAHSLTVFIQTSAFRYIFYYSACYSCFHKFF